MIAKTIVLKVFVQKSLSSSTRVRLTSPLSMVEEPAVYFAPYPNVAVSLEAHDPKTCAFAVLGSST
jgi:hypothetical protein